MILGENISKVYNKGKEIQKVYSYGKLVWENKNSEDIDYTTIPFTITAVADDVSVRLRGNEGVNVNYKYSINGGSWVETDTSTTINIKKNDEVSFININTKIDGTSQYIRYCDIIGLSDVSGNIMALGYGDDFIDKVIWWSNYQLGGVYGFFTNCDIRNAKNLILPATELSSWGYANMFRNCKSLITPPKISWPRYASEYCYYRMFENCTSLTTAPELPITSLRNGCYYRMFYGCTSLTTAPELPTDTLTKDCYFQMFQNCSNLNYIKCYAQYNITSNISDFAKGAAPTGKLVCYKEVVDAFRQYIPSGWTVEYI